MGDADLPRLVGRTRAVTFPQRRIPRFKPPIQVVLIPRCLMSRSDDRCQNTLNVYAEAAGRLTGGLSLSKTIRPTPDRSASFAKEGDVVTMSPSFIACGRVIRFARRGVGNPDGSPSTPPLPSSIFRQSKAAGQTTGGFSSSRFGFLFSYDATVFVKSHGNPRLRRSCLLRL